jgi:hypothetical protein
MIVEHDHRRGVAGEGALHDLAGMDGDLGQGAAEVPHGIDQRVEGSI